jgi:carbon-monoxide dehydrogenase medium subunit
MLLGQSPERINPQAVAECAVADTAPFDDQHASAEYRRTVATRIFVRTLRDALKIGEAA